MGAAVSEGCTAGGNVGGRSKTVGTGEGEGTQVGVGKTTVGVTGWLAGKLQPSRRVKIK